MTGAIFESTGDAPYWFTLGESKVIHGWELGFKNMTKGERALLSLKPSYAYGSGDESQLVPRPPKVASGDAVEFDIELIDFVRPEDRKDEL